MNDSQALGQYYKSTLNWESRGQSEKRMLTLKGQKLIVISGGRGAARDIVEFTVRAGSPALPMPAQLTSRRQSAMLQTAAAWMGLSIVGLGELASPSYASETTIEQMPATLETQFALSAVPPALRGAATVYLLDPKMGYQLSRQGTSGVTCLVERTVWGWSDFRNDIFIPPCYHTVGTKAHSKVIMDTASLRAQGMSPSEVKAEIANRYTNKTYRAPEKAGLSYMVAPVMRRIGTA